MSGSSWSRQDETKYLLEEARTDVSSPVNGLLLSSEEEEEEDEALSLPSAGVANIRGEVTDVEGDEDDDVSIGDLDWGDADKEVNDFLAELGEDFTDESDNESVTSTGSQRGRKRKRGRERDSSRENSDAEESDVASDTDVPQSRLAKRIQTVKSRKSQLSKSVVVNSKGSSAAGSPNGSSHGDAGASPNGSTADKDSNDDESEDNEGEDNDGEDSDLDDWANEFEKELE
jgi:hypothetical protein